MEGIARRFVDGTYSGCSLLDYDVRVRSERFPPVQCTCSLSSIPLLDNIYYTYSLALGAMSGVSQLLAMEPEVNVFVIMVEAHNRNQLRRMSEEASSEEVRAPCSIHKHQIDI